MLVKVIHPCAICVPTALDSMENITFVDTSTPTGGDGRDAQPPYIGDGHYRKRPDLSYTDEVAGPSPVPPTRKNQACLWETPM
jgi:hypothetical protein